MKRSKSLIDDMPMIICKKHGREDCEECQKKRFRVSLPNATGAIVLNSTGFVVQAAPALSWMLHKHISFVQGMVIIQHGSIKSLNENELEAASH